VTNDAPGSPESESTPEAPTSSTPSSDEAASERLAVRTEERSSAKAERPHIPVWQETLILLVIAVVLAIVLKAFFVQAFYIPSESMEPGLVKNDRILVQKPSYWAGSPSRGDVVVFEDPGDWLGENDTEGPSNFVGKALEAVGLFPSGGHLVKRVIGVPGDTIVCCDDQGRLSINGQVIDEKDYARPGKNGQRQCYGPMTGNCDWTAGPVPEGKVFVMGDNRGHSADSTVHLCVEGQTDCVPGREFVSDDLIVGKVFALVWPLSRFGGAPSAGDAFAKVPDAK
jgi:signal peptidase I